MVRFSFRVAAAASCFVFDLIALVSGMRYDISPGWRSINNESLDGVGGDGGPSYRILRAGEDRIVSDNGSFSLAYFDPRGTNEYYLCVLLHPGSTKPAPATLVVPIWTANSNSSLSAQANLMLTSTHQKFILLDSINGSLKWSSGNVVGIAGVDLDETGNLVFYGKDGRTLWQSFEHPTDVLVPGQSLRHGMSMTSSNSSQFRGTMEASGFVFYVLPQTVPTMADMLRKPQPYQVWSIDESKSLDSALQACGSSNAEMSVTYNSIEISSSRDCVSERNPLEVFRSDRSLSPASGYWKLEQTGDFVLREFHETEQNWVRIFALSALSKDSCKNPTACGSYGFCNVDGKCQCVRNEALDDQTSSSRCSPPSGVSVSCLANEAFNHHFVKIPSATYFSNKFATPDVESSSLDDCSSVCASNCSCAAAFFSHKTGGCFLVDELMGSLSFDPEQADYTAMIKIQNSRLVTTPIAASTAAKGTSKSARTAIIFLAVLCGVLAVMLAVGFYVIKTKYPHAYNKMMRKS